MARYNVTKYNAKEAAEYLGISVKKIKALMKEGKIKYTQDRKNGPFQIDEKALEKHLNLSFMDKVEKRLNEMVEKYPLYLLKKKQAVLECGDQSEAIPDFWLVVDMPHDYSHYFIECYDKKKSPKTVLEKIRNIKTKYSAKTFMFVHPKEVQKDFAIALREEGVMYGSIKDFNWFLKKLDLSLNALINVVRRRKQDIEAANPPEMEQF